MCDPVTIGAAAVGAAGSMISASEANSNQSRMINARNAATQAELQRQREFQAKSSGEFNKSLEAFNPQAQADQLAQAQTSAATALTNNAPTAANVGSITTASAPRVVAEGEASKIADVFAKTAQSSQARGKLAGWDQRAFNNNVGLNDRGRNLDMTSDFAKTSSAVSGIEQKAAYNNAYKPPSGIGDLLQFAGQVGGYKAGQGWSPFAGGTPKAPAVMPSFNARGLY